MRFKVVKKNKCFPYVEFSGKHISGKVHLIDGDLSGYYQYKFTEFHNNSGNLNEWVDVIEKEISIRKKAIKELNTVKTKIKELL